MNRQLFEDTWAGEYSKHVASMFKKNLDDVIASEVKELEERIFKIKQIGDRLFMLANRLNHPERTPELDEAIQAWASVHKDEV